MKTRTWKAAVLALSALMVGGALGAQPFTSGHWKSRSHMEGGPQGDMDSESELWMKDKKVRIKTRVMGMEMNVVKSGDYAYQWQDGQTTGMKIAANMRRRAGASTDYLEKMDDIRSKGKKIGSEKVDGHDCDIYEYSEPAPEGAGARGPTKGTYWLAKDLKNFPVKTISDMGTMKITTTNYDIDLAAHVTDAQVTPPENVKFQDMSEMMKGMAPKN